MYNCKCSTVMFNLILWRFKKMSKPTAVAKVSTKTSAQLTVARLRAAATKAKDELKAANEVRRTERASAKSQKEATKVERTE